MISTTRWPVVVATMLALAPPVFFATRWPDYSAVRDYISELGARGAPDALVVNLSFAVAGVAVIWACRAIGRARPVVRGAMWMVAAIGASYVVAAVVPCDAGCPSEGSGTQALHNLSGALGYLVGGLGLLAAGGRLAKAGNVRMAWQARLAGVVVIGGLVALGAPEFSDVRGAMQRLVEVAAFFWLVAAGWQVEPVRPGRR